MEGVGVVGSGQTQVRSRTGPSPWRGLKPTGMDVRVGDVTATRRSLEVEGTKRHPRD